ncbi:MAG: phosphopantothenoylcysteine decarboxylase [Candidatus Omnitrophota bacterium]
MTLRNKRILITAGPTWAPIDSVRVISNISTGKTGVLLAENLAAQGSKVTLLLGPIGAYRLNKKIKVIDFKFFDELSLLVKKELKKRYAAVIHAAAVSDYAPVPANKAKLSSSRKILRLTLKQAPKIICGLRGALSGSFLAGFKFEPGLSDDKLIKKARSLLKKAGLDLVVANTAKNRRYAAYLVSRDKTSGCFSSKEKMAKALTGLIGKKI